MKVLIIGNGGREHALAWKIAQSPKVKTVYCAPGNAGTACVAENVDIPADAVDHLLAFALDKKIGLTVVGPEQPLTLGLADRFREKSLRVFGPGASAARIEASKAFCKDLMRKYGIPSADYRVFDSAQDARDHLRTCDRIVVKADGLAGGKGVYVCKTRDEALAAVTDIMEKKLFGPAGDRVVIEECLIGQEVSFLAFTDGKTIVPLESAQDHKAVYDGDAGPNTGGMGVYSPTPLLSASLRERVMAQIMYPAVRALEAEGCPYQGLLYAGLMITAGGPQVLEFNARFGDPETQPLMMRLNGDLVPILEACTNGTLLAQKVEWSPRPAVCVVMTAKGYPGNYEKGKEIRGLEEAGKIKDVVVFHAGTKLNEKQGAVTAGGRVLGVTALGDDLPTAIRTAYSAVEKIKWDGLHYRTDIGQKALR
jgi:phosphoribosylamine--glycine ligase